MRCRYCKKFKSVTLESGNFPKGLYKTERICSYLGEVVHRDTLIYKTVKDKETKTPKKVFCPGFELDESMYCEQGYVISVEGCLRRQNNEEEMECRKCKRKKNITEMKKISFLMKRKRAKEKVAPKPIVR